MRPILCVDMDEVIADALGEHLLRYKRDFGINITAEDLRGRWLGDLIPSAHLPTVEQYILADDFFAVLGVMPGSQRVKNTKRQFAKTETKAQFGADTCIEPAFCVAHPNDFGKPFNNIFRMASQPQISGMRCSEPHELLETCQRFGFPYLFKAWSFR
jgi:hypothetical protein